MAGWLTGRLAGSVCILHDELGRSHTASTGVNRPLRYSRVISAIYYTTVASSKARRWATVVLARSVWYSTYSSTLHYTTLQK